MEYYNSMDEVISDITGGSFDSSEVVSFLKYTVAKHEAAVAELEDEVSSKEAENDELEIEICDMKCEIDDLEREKRQMFTDAFLISDILDKISFDGTVLYNCETSDVKKLKYLIQKGGPVASSEQFSDLLENISEEHRITLKFIPHKDNLK